MRLDRAELTGTGAAVAFHIVLIAALSMSLASVAPSPEPPSMEVELIDEVGLQSSAPQPATPPPPSQAPDVREMTEPAPAPPVEAPPPPVIKPAPAPRMPPPAVKPPPSRPQTRPAPARPTPTRPAPRVSRIGDNFLKGIDDAPASRQPAKPAAATFDARAKASVAQMIADQIRPCALQQRELGPGANRIQVVLNLQLHPSGRLRRSPTVVSVSGEDDENAQFVELVVNQAIASYRQCSPLRLPADLYQTPEGGWANINMRYRVP